MDELCRAVGELAARRTVLRKLDELVRLGWVSRTGKARATRYHLTDVGRRELLHATTPFREGRLREPEETFTDETAAAEPSPDLVPHPPLTAEAKQARDIIRQPTGLRKVCGYRREFLEAYEPGKSWYLPADLRAKLRAAGQSEHMAAMPPGTYARQVLDRLLIDLSWNSSRLEGNTYSLLETDHLLALGRSEDPARYIEAQMILNHKAAIEFLVESPSELGYNRYTFLNLHAVLTDGLLKNRAAEGSLRTQPVGIGGSVFHPLNNPPVIEECFDLILRKVAAIPDPLEQCFFLMVHLPYLQPFEDGNKRTSRLAANLPLIQQNFSPISYVDMPVRDYADGILAVYELNRVEVLRDVFAWAYERSAGRYSAIRQEIGEPEPARVRYRDEIKARVRDIVVRGLDKPSAARELRRWAAQNITASDRSYFIEMVEQELLGLKESNIVRVRLRPSEFHAWLPGWQGAK
jgi:fido (protein-threonine AMPylation protein)